MTLNINPRSIGRDTDFVFNESPVRIIRIAEGLLDRKLQNPKLVSITSNWIEQKYWSIKKKDFIYQNAVVTLFSYLELFYV